MRRQKSIVLEGGETVTVLELRAQDVVALLDALPPVMEGAQLLELVIRHLPELLRLLGGGCLREVGDADLDARPVSELLQIWDAFQEVNSAFLSLVRPLLAPLLEGADGVDTARPSPPLPST